MGSACSLSYLAVYVARNILGAVSPQMEAGSAFSKESIGIGVLIWAGLMAVGVIVALPFKKSKAQTE